MFTLGSGKFETPWLRMHRAYAYAAVASLFAPPWADCEPVVADGPFEPHPAASAASPASATASAVRR